MARKGTLTVRIIGDEKSFKNALDSAKGAAEGFGSALPGILGAAGGLAGAALAAGVFEAFERDAATDRLGAALGLSASEMEAAGRIAGEVWSEAFGDDIGEVNAAIEGVASTLGSFADLGEDRIGDLARDALTIADVFNLDVSEAISAAGVLLNSDLVDDAEEAFDTITRGLQEMPAGLRGELLEASTEYGKFFEDLGFDASEAFSVLIQGAEDGMFGIDKAGDAIKEFGIRATDMSTATQDAFETMGMDAETMAGRLLEGGSVARGAFDEIIEGLLEIEDPVDQANTAIALFGTPLEDLSVNEIPTFLESLSDIEGGLGDVEDATDRVGDTAYDNIGTRWTELWRGAQQAFLTFADENVIPAAERIVDAFEEDGLAGAMDQVRVEWDRAWPQIETWLEETVAPALVSFGATVGAAMAEAMWDAFKDFATPDFDFLLQPDPIVSLDELGDWASGLFDNGGSGPSGEPPNQTRTPGASGGSGGGLTVKSLPARDFPLMGDPADKTSKMSGGVTIQTLNVGSVDDADTMGRELRKLAIAGAYGVG